MLQRIRTGRNRQWDFVAEEGQEPEHQSGSDQRNGAVPVPLGCLVGVPAVDQHPGDSHQSWNQQQGSHRAKSRVALHEGELMGIPPASSGRVFDTQLNFFET